MAASRSVGVVAVLPPLRCGSAREGREGGMCGSYSMFPHARTDRDNIRGLLLYASICCFVLQYMLLCFCCICSITISVYSYYFIQSTYIMNQILYFCCRLKTFGFDIKRWIWDERLTFQLLFTGIFIWIWYTTERIAPFVWTHPLGVTGVFCCPGVSY